MIFVGGLTLISDQICTVFTSILTLITSCA